MATIRQKGVGQWHVQIRRKGRPTQTKTLRTKVEPETWARDVDGVGDIEIALKRAAKGYVLGVNANHPFRSWGKSLAVAGAAKDIAEALPEDAWRRLSAGDGTKGARLHDWALNERGLGAPEGVGTVGERQIIKYFRLQGRLQLSIIVRSLLRQQQFWSAVSDAVFPQLATPLKRAP